MSRRTGLVQPGGRRPDRGWRRRSRGLPEPGQAWRKAGPCLADRRRPDRRRTKIDASLLASIRARAGRKAMSLDEFGASGKGQERMRARTATGYKRSPSAGPGGMRPRPSGRKAAGNARPEDAPRLPAARAREAPRAFMPVRMPRAQRVPSSRPSIARAIAWLEWLAPSASSSCSAGSACTCASAARASA